MYVSRSLCFRKPVFSVFFPVFSVFLYIYKIIMRCKQLTSPKGETPGVLWASAPRPQRHGVCDDDDKIHSLFSDLMMRTRIRCLAYFSFFNLRLDSPPFILWKHRLTTSFCFFQYPLLLTAGGVATFALREVFFGKSVPLLFPRFFFFIPQSRVFLGVFFGWFYRGVLHLQLLPSSCPGEIFYTFQIPQIRRIINGERPKIRMDHQRGVTRHWVATPCPEKPSSF